MSGQGDGLSDASKIATDEGGYKPEIPSQEVISWFDRHSTSSARTRKVRGGNYVQIATVAPDGSPTCRTVVFRGWVETEDGQKALKMITDVRSEKVVHVAANPACEMVWWIAKTSEQYRIQGDLQLIGNDHDNKELVAQRKQQWGNLSDAAREQFFWESPGVPFSGAPSPPKGGRNEDGELIPAPDTFLLMLLWPKKVKYLRLTDNFAQNDHLTESGAWVSSRVNP
eukprot:CAMPEP_0114225290 /NCGR_PEP_ID=MMETSP0058-20121206/582_1 /TAXON_ID=36894 /ORGANISM="Pyramimonas parkeae, CCMP726" /LENGTH=225 /DNA_ID=CAMNT_0001335863 /DNA_START=196 /DNA_END=873 /DNA_ORIENTATION=-